MNSITKNNKLNILFVTLAFASRLVPHPPNFSFMGGYSLFAGANGHSQKSFVSLLLPFLVLGATDTILGFHDQIPGVYAAFLAVISLGYFAAPLLAKGHVITNSLLSATSTLLFFVISNLWVWWTTYPHDFQSLVTCMTLALPFLGWALLGDLVATHLFVTLPASRFIPKLAKDRL